MKLRVKGAAVGLLLIFTTSLNTLAQNTETPAEKARRELADRQKAVIAANESATRENEAIALAFAAGNAALAAKKYTEAIAEYDKGLAGAPNHPGASSLLANKSSALRARGVQVFNTSLATTDVNVQNRAREAGRKDFRDAVTAANDALRSLNALPQAIAPADIARYKANKYVVLSNRAESYRLFVSRVDPTQVDAGMNAYKEYWAVEESSEKRTRTRVNAGQMLFDIGQYLAAASELKSVLASDPANVDALYWAGVALFAGKNNYKEGVGHLQKFLELASSGDSRRQTAADALAYMKSELRP
jgi:tetratricopeptide (TPR) repeat protein